MGFPVAAGINQAILLVHALPGSSSPQTAQAVIFKTSPVLLKAVSESFCSEIPIYMFFSHQESLFLQFHQTSTSLTPPRPVYPSSFPLCLQHRDVCKVALPLLPCLRAGELTHYPYRAHQT